MLALASREHRLYTARKYGSIAVIAALAAWGFLFWIPSGYDLADPSTETRWGHICELLLTIGALSMATTLLDRSGGVRSELAIGVGVGLAEILPSLRQAAVYSEFAIADRLLASTVLAVDFAVFFVAAFVFAFSLSRLVLAVMGRSSTP